MIYGSPADIARAQCPEADWHRNWVLIVVQPLQCTFLLGIGRWDQSKIGVYLVRARLPAELRAKGKGLNRSGTLKLQQRRDSADADHHS